MKNRVILFALACVLCIGFLYAATEQWSIEMGNGAIVDIKADGYGGGAFVFSGSTGYQIVWIDKKGNKIFEKTITIAMPTLTAVTKKNLVYQLMGGSVTQVIVDKKQKEQTISASDGGIYSSNPAGTVYSSAYDKKGFLVWKQNTNGVITVIRYSYK